MGGGGGAEGDPYFFFLFLLAGFFLYISSSLLRIGLHTKNQLLGFSRRGPTVCVLVVVGGWVGVEGNFSDTLRSKP